MTISRKEEVLKKYKPHSECEFQDKRFSMSPELIYFNWWEAASCGCCHDFMQDHEDLEQFLNGLSQDEYKDFIKQIEDQ